LGPLTLCANLGWRWSLKQSCNPRWEFSNGMWHVTCTQGNRGDYWILVARSSFGHNLCFKCLNGSCAHILNIYVPKKFQGYKELLNLMDFDLYNCSLKIQKSIGIPTPKVGAPLGVWRFIPSRSFTLMGAWNVTPGLSFWPATLQALALVARPRLGLR